MEREQFCHTPIDNVLYSFGVSVLYYENKRMNERKPLALMLYLKFVKW